MQRVNFIGRLVCSPSESVLFYLSFPVQTVLLWASFTAFALHFQLIRLQLVSVPALGGGGGGVLLPSFLRLTLFPCFSAASPVDLAGLYSST